ncbi:MAG: hypothetical protein GY702_10615 [Desulfobulbaceae bacterium]|nr:hypothetical protein [Desulfobulbaceae bacterium]
MKVYIQHPEYEGGKKLIELNRRKAIAEKCLNCGGFDYTSRRNCTFSDCQLFPYRSGTGKQDSKARNSAIRAFCRDYCMDGNASYVSKCTSPDCPLYAYRMNTIDRSIEIHEEV